MSIPFGSCVYGRRHVIWLFMGLRSAATTSSNKFCFVLVRECVNSTSLWPSLGCGQVVHQMNCPLHTHTHQPEHEGLGHTKISAQQTIADMSRFYDVLSTQHDNLPNTGHAPCFWTAFSHLHADVQRTKIDQDSRLYLVLHRSVELDLILICSENVHVFGNCEKHGQQNRLVSCCLESTTRVQWLGREH